MDTVIIVIAFLIATACLIYLYIKCEKVSGQCIESRCAGIRGGAWKTRLKLESGEIITAISFFMVQEGKVKSVYRRKDKSHSKIFEDGLDTYIMPILWIAFVSSLGIMLLKMRNIMIYGIRL